MSRLRVLDLFSGIGGFSLGLERTGGFETAAFCEIEPFPRRVLAKHWPEVPCYDDVRTLTAERLRADGICVDVICGGFPCQDISVAGKGEGLAGKRSGLWSQIARLAGELRPRFLIVENVSNLLGRGLGTVLGDLASLGYDAEWHCIPASAVGAPHQRDRLWLVAYADVAERWPHNPAWQRMAWADALSQWQQGSDRSSAGCEDVADADGLRGLQSQGRVQDFGRRPCDGCEALDDAVRGRHGASQEEVCPGRHGALNTSWWAAEPNVGRMAHGVPARVDRLRALGNAVVPQIPELIGNAILASLAQRVAA